MATLRSLCIEEYFIEPYKQNTQSPFWVLELYYNFHIHKKSLGFSFLNSSVVDVSASIFNTYSFVLK